MCCVIDVAYGIIDNLHICVSCTRACLSRSPSLGAPPPPVAGTLTAWCVLQGATGLMEARWLTTCLSLQLALQQVPASTQALDTLVPLLRKQTDTSTAFVEAMYTDRAVLRVFVSAGIQADTGGDALVGTFTSLT